MIIVTGANGFIGSAIAWELNQKKYPVLACVDLVSLEQRSELLKKRQYQKFILKNQIWDFLNNPENQKKVTWIIHMGANSSTTETNAEHLWENNTFYTQRLFEWCTQHKKGFIYASSAATYGEGDLGYSDELDSEQLKPMNLYGESKVKFDRWVFKQPKTPPHWYGLKFFNVFGPNEYHKGSMSSVVYKSFEQIKATGSMNLFKSYNPLYKDGEQKRDFVYVKEIADWIITLIEKKPQSNIFNMGYGEARSWVDLVSAVFKAMNRTPKINFVDMPENIRHQYQYYTKADMTKWLRLGLPAPKWDLEKSIDDYVKNYLLQRDPYL